VEVAIGVPGLSAERAVTCRSAPSTPFDGLEVVLAEAHSIPKFHGELFSGRATRRLPIARRDWRNDCNRGAHGNSETREPPDRRRFAAHRSGSSSNAGADTSAISFSGLSEFAEPLLGLVNELAREAAFPEAEFERERRQKLEK